MNQALPRLCRGCGINRRAERGGTLCWDCLPGGPHVPPPCRRCGTTKNFFASGLCGRCHQHGPIRIDACPDCHAWGATQHHGWMCAPCVAWRATHRTVATCSTCATTVTVSAAGVCRLCRVEARRQRTPKGALDLTVAARTGAQLFLANLHKKRTNPTSPEEEPHEIEVPVDRRPVDHEQLVLFSMARVFTRGRASVPAPRDPVLAAILDCRTLHFAEQAGWAGVDLSKTRAGMRLLLGLQDTPGAAIRRSELAVLSEFFVNQRLVAQVLEDAGMLVDDRDATVQRWFETRITGLPAAMTAELNLWFSIMHNGSTTPPRRRPRSETTIRLYARATLPTIRSWVDDGHGSLREIERSHVLAALPADPTDRRIHGQAMRSIFGILKANKAVFINPTSGLAHIDHPPLAPAPINLDHVRDALASPDPARAAVVALTVFHGLTNRQLRELRLVDLRDLHVIVGDRSIPHAPPVRQRVGAWLDHRNQRWPDSTNPHLFIHFRTAGRLEPVGNRWIYLTVDLPGGTQRLRADRILHEAAATGGDARRLCDLFGIGINQASRYIAAITEPAMPDPS
ncbi:MAG: hypothetical protein OSA99_20060 [Acidimicrobiales bacterium]|nr:hypothetical protein [Acidimicrobiales bacterium]